MYFHEILLKKSRKYHFYVNDGLSNFLSFWTKSFETNLSIIKMFESFECIWLHEHFSLYQQWISIKKPRSSISRTVRYFNQKQNFGKFLRNFHFETSFFDSILFGVEFGVFHGTRNVEKSAIFSKNSAFPLKIRFFKISLLIMIFFSDDYYYKRFQRFQSFSYLGYSCLGFLPLLKKEALDQERRRIFGGGGKWKNESRGARNIKTNYLLFVNWSTINDPNVPWSKMADIGGPTLYVAIW